MLESIFFYQIIVKIYPGGVHKNNENPTLHTKISIWQILQAIQEDLK